MGLSDNIKKYRNNKGLTQKELAERSGLTRESIGNYERGDRIPNVFALQALTEALEVPVTHLLGTTETINGEIVNRKVPDEIKEISPSKKLTEKEIQIKRKEYLKKMHIQNPMDKYISNIYDRHLKNKLTDKDIKDIDNYMRDQQLEIHVWGYENARLGLHGYEEESYDLFTEMLKSMGYDLKNINTIALFRMIKSQIEFTTYLVDTPPEKEF